MGWPLLGRVSRCAAPSHSDMQMALLSCLKPGDNPAAHDAAAMQVNEPVDGWVLVRLLCRAWLDLISEPTWQGMLVCRFADALLHNLWRWLGSRQAALYSPGLHLAVASLQRKLLAQVRIQCHVRGLGGLASMIQGALRPHATSAADCTCKQ